MRDVALVINPISFHSSVLLFDFPDFFGLPLFALQFTLLIVRSRP
jgi:hypothetical protein